MLVAETHATNSSAYEHSTNRILIPGCLDLLELFPPPARAQCSRMIIHVPTNRGHVRVFHPHNKIPTHSAELVNILCVFACHDDSDACFAIHLRMKCCQSSPCRKSICSALQSISMVVNFTRCMHSRRLDAIVLFYYWSMYSYTEAPMLGNVCTGSCGKHFHHTWVARHMLLRK
jgi:hypothetical protein